MGRPVGTYSYPLPNHANSHQVSGITGTVAGLTNPLFAYDGNGNLKNGLNRYVISTTANLPKTIDRLTDGTLSSSNLRIKFLYGPERQRVQELTRTMNGANSGPVTRTVFKAEGIEKDIDQVAGSTRIRTALPLGLGFTEEAFSGTSIAATASALPNERWYLKDHLGSVALVTDAAGTVLQRFDYDAWGRRRQLNGADGSWGALGAGSLANLQDHQGFTDEEQLDDFGLVHLNGRLYDPVTGRMMSADPTVPDPYDPQSLNRASYVLNNPLRYVDPSGFDADDAQRVTITANVPNETLWQGLRALKPNNWWVPSRTQLRLARFAAPRLTRILAVRGAEELGVQGCALATGGACELATILVAFELAQDLTKLAHDVAAFSEAKEDEDKDAVGANSGGTGNAQPPNGDDDGKDKSWSKARSDYWKNRAANAKEGEFSPENLERMQQGKAPLHDELGVSKELHHEIPQRNGGSHSPSNLREVWPWEHDAIASVPSLHRPAASRDLINEFFICRSPQRRHHQQGIPRFWSAGGREVGCVPSARWRPNQTGLRKRGC